MVKISFIGNIWGTPKGHSYVMKDMVKILKTEGHDISMYRILNNQPLPDFPTIDNLKTEPTRQITKENFEMWLDEVKPDWCVFMEYCQWWEEDHDKLQICKDRGIKTTGMLVLEKLNWDKLDHYKLYTKIITPTEYQSKLQRSHGLYNTVYTPWGIDLKEIDKVPNPNMIKTKLRFFHCAGSGGVGDRKNTEAVIKAYKQIQDATTDLKITHLNSKVFSREEIIGFMKYADVLINASKWDTIGLNTLEANACGIPAIVSDAGPMNDLVQNQVNGFVVGGVVGTNENVTCPSFEVDVDALATKMSLCKNKMILEVLKRNSRKAAETRFNWDINKKEILKVFS